MMEQLLPGFVDESKEIVDRVTEHLIELEKTRDEPRFDDLARGLHTLKGSAATLGLAELAELAHRMEDAVLPLRKKPVALPGALTDALLKTLDVWMHHLRATAAKSKLPDLSSSKELLDSVRRAMETVDSGKGASNAPARSRREPKRERPERVREPEDASAAAASADAASSGDDTASWRVRTREVTALLSEVERLREVRLRVEERSRELGRAVQQLSSLGMLAETAEARALIMGVQRALSADGEEAGDIVASMEEQLKAICTLPLRSVLEPLRRSVRDLCKQSGKVARLSVVGGEMSLDRRVLE